MNREASRHRILAIVFLMLIGFVIVAFRAQYLTVTVAQDHLARGQWRTVSVVSVEGPRGAIVDREGRALAESVLAYSLVLDPRHFFVHEADRRAALENIVVGRGRLSREQMDAWIASEVASLPRSFVVERRVSPSVGRELMESLREARISALYLVPEYQRVYPHRTLAGHTIGFTQRFASEGLAGIERSHDSTLRGQSASWTVERDIARRPFLRDEVPDIRAAAGHTVELALDLSLQRFVESALADTVRQYRAESGTVIVSRPDTGELLAMASWPLVDPNHAHDFPADRWLHPAVAHAWEPGSTAKAFTFAMAFERDLIRPDSMIDTANGRLHVGGHVVRDIRRERELSASRVMALSSNIGALRIGMGMSDQEFREGMVDFGFSSRPGTGLPGETVGLLRRTPWREIEHANIAFGHGFAASPLQLHMATAAIANDGVRMRPLLVRRVVSSAGEVVVENVPTQAGRVVSSSAAARTTATLVAATVGEGTGVRANIPGFTVAGKTGTGEIYNPETGRYEQEYLSSFAGFAPADDPRVVVTVQIVRPDNDIGYYGGVVAAPLFSRVAAEALRSMGIYAPADVVPAAQPRDGLTRPVPEPDDSRTIELAEGFFDHLPGDGPIRIDALEPAGPVVPDLLGMPAWQAIRLAAEHGLEVHVSGSGRVIEQSPAPGTPAAGIGLIRVELAHPVASGSQEEARRWP